MSLQNSTIFFSRSNTAIHQSKVISTDGNENNYDTANSTSVIAEYHDTATLTNVTAECHDNAVANSNNAELQNTVISTGDNAE